MTPISTEELRHMQTHRPIDEVKHFLEGNFGRWYTAEEITLALCPRLGGWESLRSNRRWRKSPWGHDPNAIYSALSNDVFTLDNGRPTVMGFYQSKIDGVSRFAYLVIVPVPTGFDGGPR